MMKYLSIAAMAIGVAVAQEGTLDSGVQVSGTTLDRIARDTISVTGLADDVASLTATVGGISAAFSDPHTTGIVNNIAASVNAEATRLNAQNAVVNRQINDLTTQIRNQGNSVQQQLSSNAASQASRLTAAMSDLTAAGVEQSVSVAATVSSMNAASVSQMAAAATTMSSLTATLERSVSSSVSANANSMTTMNRTLGRALAAKRDTFRHHWTGGCSGNRNGGWNWYCLDRIESDTSAPYFRKQNNDRFVTTRAGLFRLNFFTINNSCGWAHSGAFVQGRWVTMTHLHTWQSWWKDVYNDVEFRAQNGHYFGIRTHAACGHTSSYHYSSHGRIEAEYIGTWT